MSTLIRRKLKKKKRVF